jgi:hypothetical protein
MGLDGAAGGDFDTQAEEGGDAGGRSRRKRKLSSTAQEQAAAEEGKPKGKKGKAEGPQRPAETDSPLGGDGDLEGGADLEAPAPAEDEDAPTFTNDGHVNMAKWME